MGQDIPPFAVGVDRYRLAIIKKRRGKDRFAGPWAAGQLLEYFSGEEVLLSIPQIELIEVFA